MPDPHMYSDFSTDGPIGGLDPSRATNNFKAGGGGSGLYLVGGSMQEDGKSPYDINANNAAGDPANQQTIWGINAFQSHTLGGDII